MPRLMRKRRPNTPGEILRELYLKERDIRPGDFADAIGVSYKHLNRILNGHVAVTADMAVRLSKALDTSVGLWINLQANLDAWDAEQAAKSWKPKKVFRAA